LKLLGLQQLALLFLFIFLGQPGYAASAPPVVLNPQQTTYDLRQNIEIYIDPTNQLTIQQVSSPEIVKKFIPFTALKNKRQYDTTSWVRFRIDNPTDQAIHVFFTKTEPVRVKEWTVYTKNQQGQLLEIPRKTDASFQAFLFPLEIPAHASQIFYAGIYFESFVPYAFILQKPYEYAVSAMDQYFIYGIQYGIPIALLLHSLIVFLLLRDKNYLIYVLFVSVYLIVNVLSQGLLSRVPNYTISSWFFLHLFRFLMVASGFLYVLFAKTILQAKQYVPRLNVVINIYLFASIPLAILAWFHLNNFYYPPLYNTLATFMHGLYAILSLVLAFIAAVLVMLQGYKPARYYLAGMVCLLIGTVGYLLAEANILPREAFYLQAAAFGLNADMILQAIALAVRFNLIQEAELNAQKEIVHQKELNADIQRKALLSQQKLTLSYARFFPHHFLDLLHKKSITEVVLGDYVEKNMTVLFGDLRNFTTILEKKSSTESFEFINTYLRKIGPVVRKHDGFIDKYVGDAILALFETTPDSAILTAIDITRLLKQSDAAIDMGIGIHYGSLMLGTIGEKKRMDGTVISDTVNTTSRLESLTKLYGTHVLITEQVIEVLQNKNLFKLRFVDDLYMKGKQKDIKIYEVFDVDSPDIIEKKLQIMPDYDAAIALYQQQQFQRALSLFKQCQQALPDDSIISLYIARSDKWLQSPPPKLWEPIGQFRQVMEVV